MSDRFYEELHESLEEIIAVHKGERPATRRFRYKGPILVEIHEMDETVWSLEDAAKAINALPQPPESPEKIRKALRQTQAGFAELLGVSVRTLQNWEQGRREPAGAARRLLDVARRYPMQVLEVTSTA